MVTNQQERTVATVNIFFDLDGTLFETAPSVVKSVNKIAEEYDLPNVEESRVASYIGKTTPVFLESLFLEHAQTPGLMDRFSYFAHSNAVNEGRLFEGVKEMLEDLTSQGCALYICSNGSVEYIDTILTATGIRQYFSGLLSAKQSTSKAHLIAEVKAEYNPVALVGDARIDTEAARFNDIAFIAARYGYGSDEDLAGADYYVDSAEEILECVNQIKNRLRQG